MSDSGITLDHGLIYEDMLPMKWQVCDSPFSASDSAKIHANNEEVLRYIDILDDHHGESANVDHSSLNSELVKLDIKFDLLLSLVTKLLTVYFPFPDPIHLKLTPHHIEWLSNEAIKPGSHGQIELYLSNRCPQFLMLPFIVDHIDLEGNAYRVSACFDGLNSSLKERLEKLIFRRHRRGVALARRMVSHGPTETGP